MARITASTSEMIRGPVLLCGGPGVQIGGGGASEPCGRDRNAAPRDSMRPGPAGG